MTNQTVLEDAMMSLTAPIKQALPCPSTEESIIAFAKKAQEKLNRLCQRKKVGDEVVYCQIKAKEYEIIGRLEAADLATWSTDYCEQMFRDGYGPCYFHLPQQDFTWKDAIQARCWHWSKKHPNPLIEACRHEIEIRLEKLQQSLSNTPFTAKCQPNDCWSKIQVQITLLTDTQANLDRLQTEIDELLKEACKSFYIDREIKELELCQRALNYFPEVKNRGLVDPPQKEPGNWHPKVRETLVEACQSAGIYLEEVRTGKATKLSPAYELLHRTDHIMGLLEDSDTSPELFDEVDSLHSYSLDSSYKPHERVKLFLNVLGKARSSILDSFFSEIYSPEVHDVSSSTCQRTLKIIEPLASEFLERHNLGKWYHKTPIDIWKAENVSAAVEHEASDWIRAMKIVTEVNMEVTEIEERKDLAEANGLAHNIKLLVKMLISLRKEKDELCKKAETQEEVIEEQAAEIKDLKLQLQKRDGA